MTESCCGVEMPKYQCHKQVWAIKVDKLEVKPECGLLHPVDKKFAPVSVTHEFLQRTRLLHPSENVDGYYVVYSDGYKSFSPADTFEEGYSLITI